MIINQSISLPIDQLTAINQLTNEVINQSVSYAIDQLTAINQFINQSVSLAIHQLTLTINQYIG